VLTRDQGQRRISAVTIGLTAASVAGILAVGAAAYAKESDGAAATNGTPGPGTATATPAPGGAATPAAPNPDSQDGAQLQPPPGKVTTGNGSGQATSGGT
jgi:hypothetical protein